MEDRMQGLIDRELSDKIMKPDFNSKTGRELLAFYLQTKFKQIITFDRKYPKPIIREVNPNFISNFSRRLINNPEKRFLISITGESAAGKSTICKEISKVIEQLSMPVTILSTDNYFNDISALILNGGTLMKKLGFGLMRMPLTDPNSDAAVDVEQVKRMVDLFMAKGFTYF